VAIVDIGLRSMDGYELAQRVRAALGSALVLVAMTGHGRESDRLNALAAGFDAHMTKPVDIELVERMLAACGPYGGAGLEGGADLTPTVEARA
jgi:CheY-like chemotaxis protein